MSEFDASSSALGYLHQIRWALLALLRAGRADLSVRVSLEKIDDVTLTLEDESLLEAQQIKHHTAETVLTDGSADFWSTLRVWLSTPSLRGPNGPRLYLITTASVPENSAVYLLTEKASDPESAAERLTALAGSLSARATERGRELWLRTSSSDRLGLLQRVTVIDNAPDILEVDNLLREELATAVRASHMDQLIEGLFGWWQEISIRVLYSSTVETISATQLYNQLHSLRDRFIEGTLPIDQSLELVDDEQIASHTGKPFTRQLEWIGVRGYNLRRAIVSYHRAYSQTAKWVLDGDLVEEDLHKFERELLEEWQIQFENLCDRMAFETSLDDRKKMRLGRDLFDRMCEQSSVVIRFNLPETFMTHGSRHSLADRGALGWHPDFREKMQSLLGVVA